MAEEKEPGPGVELTRVVVHQWQCDHFGHMNVRHYAAIFDDAVFVFWNGHGSRTADGTVPVTAETRTVFRSEVAAGTVVAVRARIERIGSKSLGLHLEMVDPQDGTVFASCDVVEVFFNLQTRGSEAIPARVRESLAAAP